MNSGQILTKVTIWSTFAAYAFGAATFAFSAKRHKWDAAARLAWTIACAALLAHVVCAFHVYHGWSHEAAYRETARQTGEVFGLNWGGGIYISYLLLVCWVVDLIWWWLGGLDSYRRRPWLLVSTWHWFVIFIIFNSTVVFETGIVRWAGLVLSLSLCLIWLFAARQRSHLRMPTGSPIRLGGD